MKANHHQMETTQVGLVCPTCRGHQVLTLLSHREHQVLDDWKLEWSLNHYLLHITISLSNCGSLEEDVHSKSKFSSSIVLHSWWPSHVVQFKWFLSLLSHFHHQESGLGSHLQLKTRTGLTTLLPRCLCTAITHHHCLCRLMWSLAAACRL